MFRAILYQLCAPAQPENDKKPPTPEAAAGFRKSLPDLQIWEDDMNRKNVIHCNYLMGLGHLGLGDKAKAEKYFAAAAALDNNHQGVSVHLKMARENALEL